MKTKSQSSARQAQPILSWPGSKRRMLKHLLPMIPPHICYAEPFAGSLALLMAKPRSTVEVVNDLNGDLVALYRNVQYHLPEVMREISWFFSSRQNLHDFRAQPGLTELQRAARFLLRNRTSFGGNMNSFGVCKTKGGGISFDKSKVGVLLDQARERLNGVVVEHLPYERILLNQDSADTFIFMDPPYVDAPTKAYDGWTIDDVKLLSKRVAKPKSKWIITLNDSPEVRAVFPDCQITPVVSANGLANNRTHAESKLREIIIVPK